MRLTLMADEAGRVSLLKRRMVTLTLIAFTVVNADGMFVLRRMIRGQGRAG
jgi:hypothetical protein